MHDPGLIWQLGRWIAQRESGAARLVWSDGEVVLRVHSGRIHSVDGLDATAVARRLDCEPVGNTDLLEEARALARERDVAETRAVGTAKEILQEGFKSWILDPERELELVEGEPDEADGPTISITHALVEMVLSDTSGTIARSIVPNEQILLRRAGNFLELYAPLRLSEEADLIVAKITGQRTAGEIADHSPHGPGETVRLLAALVATGMLETLHVVAKDEEQVVLQVEPSGAEPTTHRLPVAWIAGAAIALIVIIAGLAVWMTRSQTVEEDAVSPSGRYWAVVVDMGCEPQELQRVLSKAQQNPKSLRPVAADADSSDPCWRLVWGRFDSMEAAQGAIAEVPEQLLRDGFEPHPVEVPDDTGQLPRVETTD